MTNNNNNNKNTMENIGMKKRMKKKRWKKKGIIIHSCEIAHLPLPKVTFCPKWDVRLLMLA